MLMRQFPDFSFLQSKQLPHCEKQLEGKVFRVLYQLRKFFPGDIQIFGHHCLGDVFENIGQRLDFSGLVQGVDEPIFLLVSAHEMRFTVDE